MMKIFMPPKHSTGTILWYHAGVGSEDRSKLLNGGDVTVALFTYFEIFTHMQFFC